MVENVCIDLLRRAARYWKKRFPVSYLMIVRYGFEALIKTGDKLHNPGSGGRDDRVVHIKSQLYTLGFRTSEADDMGFAMYQLVAVLLAFLVFFLLGTTWFTWRSKEGN